MTEINKEMSLLEYYQNNEINPVPIEISDRESWSRHCQKRRNLYEKHLMIPASYFKGKSILEFGCNSGENPLYLASLGAGLTLVEPNDQVLPRLKKIFSDAGYEKSIVQLVNTDIEGFQSQSKYDVVLAEGFISGIAERERMLSLICRHIRDKGIGVISFDERYGSLLEVSRRAVFKRACELMNLAYTQSTETLTVAREIFNEEFYAINVSRPIDAWYKDVLLNPFVSWKYFWTYQEVIPIIESEGCEILSSSPRWGSLDNYTWYKNVQSPKERHEYFLKDWSNYLAFFITGIPTSTTPKYAEKTREELSNLIRDIYLYTASEQGLKNKIIYPEGLSDYLKSTGHEKIIAFDQEMKRFFHILNTAKTASELISEYHSLKTVRSLWGFSSPYISFVKT
jgi:SAM-dependent methyltransferase